MKQILNTGNDSKNGNGSKTGVNLKGISISDAMSRATRRGLEILPEGATGKEKGTTRGQVSNYFAKNLMDNSGMSYDNAVRHMANWDSK